MPWERICSSASSEKRCSTWATEAGEATATTWATVCRRDAASTAAAPPRLCPTSTQGPAPRRISATAAAVMSLTLVATVVSASSPPLSPKPVKSKARVRYPPAARPLAMRVVVNRSLEQVKQWHSRAAPTTAVPSPGR